MNRIRSPLIEIRTFDKQKFYSKATAEQFQKILENNKFIHLTLHGEKHIATSSVSDFDNASDVDYFQMMIYPKLPKAIQRRISDSLNRAIKNNPNISLKAIENRVEEIKKDLDF